MSHCSITSEGGYEYLGLYPEVGDHFNSFLSFGVELTESVCHI